MPAQKLWAPQPRNPVLISDDNIEVPDPLPQSDAIKPGILARILPLIMVGVMLGMMALMFTVMGSNGMRSPMMLMMPVMMLMGMLGQFAGGGAGGNDTAELNNERKEYSLGLRELRKKAHKQGEALHSVQTTSFPNPHILHNYIGQEDMKDPVMWQASPESPGGLLLDEGTVDEVSFSPYMSARLGLGTTNLLPTVQFNELNVAETLEPVTTQQFRSFVRTQGFVTNMPIALNLASAPAFAIEGEDENAYGLARAMIASLAFNHSPADLRIVIITDDVNDPKWEWAKWLPHCQHPTEEDALGTARLMYPSLVDFANNCQKALRPPAEGELRWVVFVDKPRHEIRPPVRTGFSTSNISAAFVVVRAGADYLATSKRARYRVDDKQVISLPGGDVQLAGDSMDIGEMERFSKLMARWKSFDYSTDESVSAGPVRFKKKNWFEILGIHDIENWNPELGWQQTENLENLEFPVGYARKGSNLTEGVVTLDISESSRGGSGPHGVGQGTTGTGKSFLIGGMVLDMCAIFSPHMLNFILMDFKGGSTFLGFDKLPHVIANISNLGKATDLLDRAQEVIEGEKQRRMEELNKYGVKDILEYRKKRVKNPQLDMPPMPNLVIVADEFREFISTHREYMALFNSVAAVGRSIGMHLFLVSQYIDKSLIGDVESQLGYGISLKVNNESESRAVIDSGKAAELSSGTGDALLKYKGGTRAGNLVEFRSFNIEENYIPPTTTSTAQHSVQLDEEETRPEADIEVFTASNKLVEFEPEPEPEVETETPEEKPREAIGQMKFVLIDRIAEFRDKVARPLWQTPLNIPMSTPDLNFPAADPDAWDLSLIIGETDAPRIHKRLPFVIRPSRPQTAHALVVGQAGSGKSTTVQAIVASTSLSYTPDKAQFLIIDFAGTKLREIVEYPSVVGYAGRTETDSIYRYLGEFKRILKLRQNEMGKRQSSNVASYLADKVVNPVKGDPYGHLFLVIDGFVAFKEAQKEAGDVDFDQNFSSLIRDATAVGLHVIITANTKNEIGYKYNESFGLVIPHKVESATDASDNREIKERVSRIPQGVPGYSVDTEYNLMSRVFVPQLTTIEPYKFDEGVPIYNPEEDFGEGIKTMAARVSKARQESSHLIVPRVEPAPSVFKFEDMWERYIEYTDLNSRDVKIPLGLDQSDVSIIDNSASGSPHMLVFGEPQSGKSTVLRNAINAVVRQRGPEGAQFLFWDPQLEFFDENKILADQGMSLFYATTEDEGDEMFETLAETLEARIPTPEMLGNMSREDIRSRAWYADEPDLFLIVDNIMSLFPGGQFGTSIADPLAAVINKRGDLGIHIYAGGTAVDAQALVTGNMKLPKAILNSMAPVSLLSGPVGGIKIIGDEKFSRHRPGEGRIYDPQNLPAKSIQFAYSDPWVYQPES